MTADVVIDFPDGRFPDVEAAWDAERHQLMSAEHRHWDWLRKLGSPDYRYVAVTLGASVEGLMAVAKLPVVEIKSAGLEISLRR